MGHLLHLMFRCDGDVLFFLGFLELNGPVKGSSLSLRILTRKPFTQSDEGRTCHCERKLHFAGEDFCAAAGSFGCGQLACVTPLAAVATCAAQIHETASSPLLRALLIATLPATPTQLGGCFQFAPAHHCLRTWQYYYGFSFSGGRREQYDYACPTQEYSGAELLVP